MLPWVFAWLASAAIGHASSAAPTDAHYIARAWTTVDGLPQNTVTSILQTRDGYLWLGTFGGLVRFDGLTFTVFDPGNSPGLVSPRIVSLYEDPQGILWIGTEVGLTKREHGRFTSFGAADGLPPNAVLCMLRDRRGRMWIGTESGLGRFEGSMYRPVPGFPAAGLSGLGIAETGDGSVWVSTWIGVYHFDPDGGEGRLLRLPGSGHVTPPVLVDRGGRVWAGGAELSRWDGNAFVAVPLPQARGRITALAEDARGDIWIGTTHGAIEWRDGETMGYDATAGLSDANIRSINVDSGGNVWIGTDVGGLNRLKPRHVFSYPRPDSTEQSIGPIVGDGRGGLWIGATCGGLFHFQNGVFRRDIAPQYWGDCVWSLLGDADGTVWIGSRNGGGLMHFDGHQVVSYSAERGLPGRLVSGIARDHEGRLWVGADHALSMWDGTRFINYGAADGLTHDIQVIFPDSHGALWVGGMTGLSRFADGRFTRITTAQGLSHDYVRAIYEDADGALWIGTYGGGLNRLKNGRFTTIGIKDGLPDSAISRIIEDARGNLWMSGNKGIYRVARRQLNDFADGKISSITAVVYGTADGMLTAETNGGQPAGWQTPDGRLWFPTIKGLVGIDPVATAPAAPPVYVEQTVINGHAIAGALPPLGPGSVDAEFHYTAIDLGAAEKTRFRYRLSGYEPQWIDAGTRRVAYYTNIPPGRYQFEVSAADSEGNWKTMPAEVAVVVVPFWWQRRASIVAGLFLLLAFTGFTVRHLSLRRAQARVKELERERALDRERTRIARDLHDDLGSRLAQIALIAEQPTPGSSDRIAGVAREAMQTMDELVWTVNARNDTAENFAEYAAEFAEEHLSLAGVRLRLQIPANLDGWRIGADTRRDLYLAFKEAVHNVVKHSGASEARIALHIDGTRLAVEIVDDGRGLTASAAAGTGNGLRNMRERMEAAGGSFAADSADGGGTRIVLRVPIGRDASAV